MQDVVSDWRVVQWAQESIGQRDGPGGSTIGHASLTWACSEAAGLFLRDNPSGQHYLPRVEKQHGQGKALTLLAHHLARAVYVRFKRHTAFEMNTVLNGEGRGAGAPDASLDSDAMSLHSARGKHALTASVNANARLGLRP